MKTPQQIAHEVCADWITGPINMGDLEDRIASALQDDRERMAEVVEALGRRWQEDGTALRLDGLNAALACAAMLRAS